MELINLNNLVFDSRHVLEKMLDSFDEVLYVDNKSDCLLKIKSCGNFSEISDGDSWDKFTFEFKRNIYPDDICRLENINLFHNGKSKSEIRLKDNSGNYRWCYFEAVAVDEHSFFAMLMDLSTCENEAMIIKSDYFNKEEKINYQYQLMEQKYKSVIAHSDIMVFELDMREDSITVFSNLQNNFLFEQNVSKPFNEFINSDFIFNEDKDAFCASIDYTKKTGSRCAKIRLKNNEGNFFECEIYFSGVCDAGGEICTIIGTVRDIDNTLKSEYIQNSFDESADKLTGLVGSKAFCREMHDILVKESDKSYAMILFDIEKFKTVNELYGLEFADEILKFIAFHLRKMFSGTDQLTGRFTSDYFGVFTEYTDDSDIINKIEKLSSRIIMYKNIPLAISYGIYKITDKNMSSRLICDYANMAKKTIKGNHIMHYAFYNEDIISKILQDKSIENEMEIALADGQFSMYLQPKYNIETSEIIGAEALVRWIHPKKGLIMPDKFIPLFEKNGFIVNLDKYIWEQACLTIRRWMDSGQKPVPISVNVSRVNVGNPRLIEILNGLVSKYNIDKRYLELEITETVYYDDQKCLMDTLKQLKNAGYTLLMDDFGSGFSSLNMLKNTPFDILKIDRNFLNETMVTDKGKKIILHTISLSNDIGINTVAEGVETKEQAEYLLKCGCNVAQGYYYSKPVTLDTFENMFHKINIT